MLVKLGAEVDAKDNVRGGDECLCMMRERERMGGERVNRLFPPPTYFTCSAFFAYRRAIERVLCGSIHEMSPYPLMFSS